MPSGGDKHLRVPFPVGRLSQTSLTRHRIGQRRLALRTGRERRRELRGRRRCDRVVGGICELINLVLGVVGGLGMRLLKKKYYEYKNICK